MHESLAGRQTFLLACEDAVQLVHCVLHHLLLCHRLAQALGPLAGDETRDGTQPAQLWRLVGGLGTDTA
eukprot:scaffold496273_cov19-Prasinocladus_malaysianus.AAC.1